MATGTVYLDVDDEITSAAARIRSSAATKVALVVPYGSRIATSRMNFRLLSREADVNNRRLSIVAADPATRALAASAGLPVFASVGEYESSLGTGDGPIGETSTGADEAAEAQTTPPAAAAATGPVAPSDDESPGAATAPDAIAPPVEPPPPPTRTPRGKRATKRTDPASEDTQVVALPLPLEPPSPRRMPPSPSPDASIPTSRPTAARIPVLKSRRMPRLGTPVAIGAALVILALVVGGVGAYVFLPAAEITVTPRQEEIGPISLVVRADPDALAVDPDGPTVPADRTDIPVEVTETFTTTGRRVEESPASGEVTFSNLDFTSSNTIAAGSIVSTQGGVRFRTNAAVTVDRARLVGLQVVPTEADVAVTAVNPGTAGNVEPNTIVIIPAGEDPISLKVRNKAATSGGTHEEFPQIVQADLDAALEALGPKLAEAFTAAVADAAGQADVAQVFPETAVLGESAPTVDPATLLGKEQPTFDLGLRASGTVIAVDASPVEQIARSRLLANVGTAYRLVDDSIEVTPGDPTVVDGQVSFPVTARAARVRILDPTELLGLVTGQTVEEAERILAAYGDVEITAWPDWVTSIPTMESRVTLTITGQGADPEASTDPDATSDPEEPSDAGASPAPNAS